MLVEQEKTSEIESQINDALADAIMVSFASQVRLKNKQMPFSFDSYDPVEAQIGRENWRKALHESLQGNCRFNSMIAAIFLADNYSHLFKHMFVVQAQVKGDYTFRHPFKRGNWSSHAGLVLEDELGSWHYITPANDLNIEDRPKFISAVFARFSQQPKSNPLLTHLTTSSLTRLMKKIEGLETRVNATIWPTAGELEYHMKVAENQQFVTPFPGQENIITIYKNWHNTLPETLSESNYVHYLREALFSQPEISE